MRRAAFGCEGSGWGCPRMITNNLEFLGTGIGGDSCDTFLCSIRIGYSTSMMSFALCVSFVAGSWR